MKTIVNLTPHTVNIIGGESIPSSGIVRVSQTNKEVDVINDINFFNVEFGDIEGLPEFDENSGKLFIVSSIVIEACKKKGRPISDLIFPTEFVRDSEGKIVGCKGFGCNF